MTTVRGATPAAASPTASARRAGGDGGRGLGGESGNGDVTAAAARPGVPSGGVLETPTLAMTQPAADGAGSGSSGGRPLRQLDGRDYTTDVVTDETLQYQFADLFLSPALVAGLRARGYVRPSPVQLHAIPTAKFGTDLIVQAKAGTGKTLVFAIVILESIRLRGGAAATAKPAGAGAAATPELQAVVVAPTREITLQISDVIRGVGRGFPALRVASFIGGVSQKEDRAQIRTGCHVAAGSPGRLYHLIRDGALDVSGVRIVVLDEADKVTQGVFHQTVGRILAALPARKQVMAFSATYTTRLNALLGQVTEQPHVLRVDDAGQVSADLVTVSANAHRRRGGGGGSSTGPGSEVFPALHGVEQIVHVLPPLGGGGAGAGASAGAGVGAGAGGRGGGGNGGGGPADDGTAPPRAAKEQKEEKEEQEEDPVLALMVEHLLRVLVAVDFRQCMVFCNDRRDTETVCEVLVRRHYPAAFISAHLAQPERQAALDRFRAGDARVLVTSDLTARGIDVAAVNLVVNLGLPHDAPTYMHRVGRAGRFGSLGRAVTIVRARDRGRVRALERIQGLRMRALALGEAGEEGGPAAGGGDGSSGGAPVSGGGVSSSGDEEQHTVAVAVTAAGSNAPAPDSAAGHTDYASSGSGSGSGSSSSSTSSSTCSSSERQAPASAPAAGAAASPAPPPPQPHGSRMVAAEQALYASWVSALCAP